jgi:hypothetical protein
VELPREDYRGLALRAGDIAYLTPTRRHAFTAPQAGDFGDRLPAAGQ